jgi:Fe-S-cluster containining protein
MGSRLHIAGLTIELHESAAVLAELESVYRELALRQLTYRRDPANPHLCFEGCSACCRSGAFFAVSLAEALRWTLAVRVLPPADRARVVAEAEHLLELQRRTFTTVDAAADVPGQRDEAVFTGRVARAAATGAACPLLENDRCSVYDARPFLCRAYGFPVDAYAVEGETAIVFRSLCHLYAGKTLQDYVGARDIHAQLAELSSRLAGGRNLGRFTSPEAILAEIE